jgi:class 3 adenylate cyclase
MEELTTEDVARRAGAAPEEIGRFAAMGILSSSKEPFRSMDVTRVRLLQALEQSGIRPEDVGAAIASGEFSFAFVDALFPEQNTAALTELDFDGLCQQFGVPFEFLQDVFAGLGLSQPMPHDRVRQDDLEMMPVLQAIRGLPVSATEGAIAHAARFWGENLRSLARAELNFFETYVMNPLLHSGLPEREMLEIALPQGQIAQELDERVLVWLHRRHVEQGMIESVLDHVEAAIERTGAIRRPPRQVPAIAFLDLSGFTALTEERGDEAAVTLTVKLSELVRSHAGRHGGRTVKFLGDGVMCYFTRPSEAVVAALEMVEEARRVQLPPARVGLHAGPVIARDSDYFGRTVNIAARVVAQAQADQVVVTEDVRSLCGSNGIRFEPLGSVALKGITEPVALHQASFFER